MARQFRVLPLAAVVAALWVGAPRPARACSCMQPSTPAAAADQARAVFEGRTFSVSHRGGKAIYRFEVSRVWKGEVAATVELETAVSSAACGRTFETGTSYVVYAYGGIDGLSDNICSRTRPASAAAEDLMMLGAGGPPIGHKPSIAAAPAVEPPRIEAAPPPVAGSGRGCSVADYEPATPWWLIVSPLVLLRRRQKELR